MSSFFSNRTTPGSQRKARSTISNTQPAFLYDEENDDFDEIENDENCSLIRDVPLFSQQLPHTTNNRSNAYPRTAFQYHTPQLKRKRGDDQSANSNSSALTEEIQKMHEMLKSINQKLDHMEQKEVIFEKQLGILNKRFGRLTDNMREKSVTNKSLSDLPAVEYNGRNLLLAPLCDSPARFMARLINELFSKEEIINGEHEKENERISKIKQAVKVCYLENNDFLLDSFWENQGKQTRGNQRRGQVFRQKKND